MPTERTGTGTGIVIAVSTRPGTAGPSGDAAAVHTRADHTAAAAVIDAIGHTEKTARVAALLADVAARITAQRGPLAGILTAAELIADPGPGAEPEPDAVAVTAVTGPDDDTTRIAWIGDARAWGWDGTRLRQYSTDQTMGEWLRIHGDVPAHIADHHDAWVRATLATAAVATVRETEIPDALVVLTTDGIHDTATPAELVAIVRAHQHDPQVLVDALTAAAREARDGHRDDATAVVLVRRPLPPAVDHHR